MVCLSPPKISTSLPLLNNFFSQHYFHTKLFKSDLASIPTKIETWANTRISWFCCSIIHVYQTRFRVWKYTYVTGGLLYGIEVTTEKCSILSIFLVKLSLTSYAFCQKIQQSVSGPVEITIGFIYQWEYTQKTPHLPQKSCCNFT